MNKKVVKILAVFLMVLMIVSVSNNTLTYAANALATAYNNVQNIIKLKANANNTALSSYDLMITNRRNDGHAYNASSIAKNVNSGDAAEDYGVLLIQDGSGKYYYCMEKGGALMLYANGGSTIREYYYTKQDAFRDNLTHEQWLALAYINSDLVTEIEGVNLNTNNNRQKLTQYYIWKSSINIGRSVTVPSIYAKAISALQRNVNNKIKIGDDVLDLTDATLLIKGTKYKLEYFDADKYTSKLIYRIDNGKGYIESNANGAGQEVLTIESRLKKITDTPKIKLQKIDDKDNGLANATFTVYDNETGNTIKAYKTGDNGFTAEIDVEYGKKYLIKETTAPSGYELSNEYAVVDVKKGETTYTVYNKDGNTVKDSKYWVEDELSDELELILKLIDKKDSSKVLFKKIDSVTKAPISGVRFDIEESNPYTTETEYFITDENGYIDLSEYLKDAGDWIDLKEVSAPNGYVIEPENSIHVELKKENGKLVLYGNAIWGNETIELEGNDELVVEFENKKQDIPSIQIYKHDNKGMAVPGVEFEILNIPTGLELSSNKLVVQNNGYTNIIDIKGMESNKVYTFTLEEKNVPQGYKKIESAITLNITVNNDGKVYWDATWKQNNNTITRSGTTKQIMLDVENQKEDIVTKNVELQILKVDSDNNNPLGGAEFTVSGCISGTLASGSDGYTNILSSQKLEAGKTYELRVKETKAPSDKYKDASTVPEIVVRFTVSNDGVVSNPEIVSTNNQGVGITFDQNTGKITLKVGNTKKKANEAFPMIMYIKGVVFLDGIEGKKSEPDGYYNPSNNSDKSLEGIKVELFDETTNAIAVIPTREAFEMKDSELNFDTSSIDFEKLEKYGKTVVYTDKDGNFEFYGLNPSHTYSLIFSYNGMRYAEIKATTETGVELSGYRLEDKNASKATETNRQSRIVDVFSEIGTYPYNYKSTAKGGAYNTAYNQDDVLEAIKNGVSKAGSYEKFYANLSSYVDESMAYFIEDTLVNAKISGLGSILSEAEGQVKKANGEIKNVAKDFVYPVVSMHDTPTVDKVKFFKRYGYNIYSFYADEKKNPEAPDPEPYWHYVGEGAVGELSYDIRKDGEWGEVSSQYAKKDTDLMKELSDKCASSTDTIKYSPKITGDWTEIKEGYEHKTIAGVEWAIFDTSSLNYLGGWDKEAKEMTYKEEYQLLSSKLKELNEDEKGNLIHANLGLQYRATLDLLLINDVLKAEVTMNNVYGEYLYNIRAASGDFNFGINESDIRAYYSGLSNENVEAMRDIKYKNSIVGTEEYYKYINSSDIYFDKDVNKSDNGTAVAGGYDETEDSIYLIYKIIVTNSTSIKGKITEIVDYYDKNFEVTKVYDKDNKEYQFSSESIYKDRGAKKAAPDGYNAAYIKLDDREIGNNEKIELYLKLKMKDIKNTLTLNVLNSENGYRVLNLAEINGYKTERGYIDFNSMPGNIVEDGKDRFTNGKYENDESKSPTIIFKNPSELARTVAGVVFEDKTSDEWSKGVARQDTANHALDENDTLIKGATVQLIQILPNGTEKLSAETKTTEGGTYKFTNLRPGSYIVRFAYGNNDATTLTLLNKIDDKGNSINVPNAKSYNGESFENTERKVNSALGAEGYWYTDSDIEANTKYSDAIDNKERRATVTNNFAVLTNEKAEVLSSYKDSKVNRDLVNKLKTDAYMFASTDVMKLELEYVGSKNPDTNGNVTIVKEDGRYTYEYDITDVDFGIVERSRAKLEITKNVSYIELKDTTGKVISSGTYDDWKNGNIKHVKWIQNEDGFVSMEIDPELLSGATLKITYDITVLDNSETGNEISEVEVIDYVTNNLNYGADYTSNQGKSNSSYGWQPITTDNLIKAGYVNNTSVTSKDDKNKIDLSTYQAILKTTFKPGETKQVTLQKNLSSDEESNFEYNNVVEIVSSKNTKGRGDYESIYGNLDPITYTSRQGNLYWDFKAGITTTGDHVTELTENSGFNSIRKAELDSASAEEVTLTVPTGSNTSAFEIIEYIIFGIAILGTAIAMIILTRKHRRFAL